MTEKDVRDLLTHYPAKNVSIFEKVSLKNIKINEPIVLMCPSCYYIKHVHVDSNINIYGTLNDMGLFINNTYACTCPACGEYDDFITLDPNIASTIQILNKKGYYTSYSCEGHVAKSTYTNKTQLDVPYISFYLWKDINILKTNPLPKTWCLLEENTDNKIFAIYESASMEKIEKSDELEDIILWGNSKWERLLSLDDIHEWALSLPEKDDETKKIDLNNIVSMV